MRNKIMLVHIEATMITPGPAASYCIYHDNKDVQAVVQLRFQTRGDFEDGIPGPEYPLCADHAEYVGNELLKHAKRHADRKANS